MTRIYYYFGWDVISLIPTVSFGHTKEGKLQAWFHLLALNLRLYESREKTRFRGSIVLLPTITLIRLGEDDADACGLAIGSGLKLNGRWLDWVIWS